MIAAPVIILPTCIEDKVQTDLRTLKVTEKSGKLLLFPDFAYCTKCRSYLIKGGRTKSELEAARDLYRQNPHLGSPRNIVSAEYFSL